MVVLVSLRAVGFRRLNLREPLAFPKGLIIIRGSNEAGKSTLLEAVLFGLYGDHRVVGALRGSSRPTLDEVVNYRSGRALVEVAFEVDGRRYRVERILERGKEGARQIDARLFEVGEGGERLVAVGVAKVNEMVQKLLKVSWQEMLVANVIAQKDLERIVEMRREERDRVINMMMGFDSYNKAIEKLEEERRQLQQELEKAGVQLRELRERVAELEERGRRLEEWRRELAELERRLPELEARRVRLERAHGYLEQLERALRLKLERRRQLEAVAQELERARASLAEREGKLSEARESLARARAELERLRGELGELESRWREAERRRGEVLELNSKVQQLWGSYADTLRDLEALRRRREQLEGELGELPQLRAERERVGARLREVVERAKAAKLPRWSVAAAAASAALGVALALLNALLVLPLAALAAVSLALGVRERARLLGALQAEERQLRDQVARIEGRLAALERVRDELENLRARERELEERRERLLGQLREIAGEAPSLEAYVESLAEAAREAQRGYEEALAALNGARQRLSMVQAEVEGLERRVRELEEEIAKLKGDIGRLEERRAALEGEYAGVAVPEPPPEVEGLEWPIPEDRVDEVSELRAGYGRMLLEATTELAKAVSMRKELSKRIEETEAELGKLPSLKAQLSELEGRVLQLEREIAARRAAVDALKGAAAKVRAAFAPSVEANMSWLISYITGGRYKAVRLNPDTYDLEVYDAEAGRWLRRNIYSGGTNDQFLLAMRIAFALSLLPAAKGAYPRFLFLDEPLGSSDSERRGRIVELIANELTRFFDQIFLVTHVEIEEPPESTVVTIEDGVVQRVYKVGSGGSLG